MKSNKRMDQKKVILVYLLWWLFYPVTEVESAGAAQEASPADISELWQLCKCSEVEGGTLVADTRLFSKSIFSKNSVKKCQKRLNSNTFLWVNTSYLRNIEKQTSETSGTLIYIRSITGGMLNINNPVHISPLLGAQKYMLLEISPGKLKRTVRITKQTFYDQKLTPDSRYYNVTAINGGKSIKLLDQRRICLDFGEYLRYKATGYINMKELRTTLCYNALKEMIIPWEFESIEQQVSGQMEIAIYEVELDILVQMNDASVSVPFSAIKTVNRLARDTIKYQG